MPSKYYLMLRSARRARLEACTALLQCVFDRSGQFPDSLAGRDPLHPQHSRFRAGKIGETAFRTIRALQYIE